VVVTMLFCCFVVLLWVLMLLNCEIADPVVGSSATIEIQAKPWPTAIVEEAVVPHFFDS